MIELPTKKEKEGAMKKYFMWGLTKFKAITVYKFNFFSNLTMPFLEFILYSIIWSLVIENNNVSTYTQKSIIIYLLLARVLSLIFSSSNVATFHTLIRSGKLPYLLLKPLNIRLIFFIECLTRNLFFFILVIFLGLFRHNFLIYFIFSTILFFNIIFTFATLAFFTTNFWPIRPIISGVISLLSGLVYPLDLLPEKIFEIVRYNPFSLIIYNSVKVFQNNTFDTKNIISIFLWSLFFLKASTFLYKRGLKKYEGVSI